MLKKFSKILLLLLLVFVISSSSLICLADEDRELENVVTAPETNEKTDTTDDESASTTPEIHNGDLYLLGNDIIMDQFVDGNVFILANNAKITGQVNGNLYVLANQVNFDGALIRYSMFICANNVYYANGGTYDSDVYIAANTLETTYSSYAARDFKVLASDVTLKSAVGRDADIICNALNLGEGSDISAIYGDLRYTSNDQIVIPGGAVQGSVTYSKQYMGNSITGILMGFGTCIVTVLALFIILNKLTPNFIQNVSDDKFSILKVLKAFGLGLATIAVVAIFVILLVGTGVGILLAVLLALLFAILYIIAVPTLVIKITNSLKPVLKLEKEYMFLLVLALVSTILYGITLIPFVGIIFNLLMKVTAVGLIVNLFLPHKEIIEEEEKVVLEESEKLAKENKEKIKKEKLEAKANKKQENDKVKSEKKIEKSKAKEAKQKSESKEIKKKNKKK